MSAYNRLLGRRYLRHRWDRVLLIVASIALGVGTLVSSQTLNSVIETAARQSISPMQGTSAYSISNGNFGVRKSLADDVKKANIPGVDRIATILVKRITLPSLGDRPAVLIGAEGDAAGPDLAKSVTLVTTDLPGLMMGSAVIVSKAIHDAAGSEKTIVIKRGNHIREFRIGGYFETPADSPVAALGSNVVAMELNAAGRFVQPEGPLLVNRIDLFCKTPSPEIERSIQAVVGDRGSVSTPETQGKSAQEIISGVTTAFTLCSLAALVVGLFLVYNAMSVTVAERRPDIGILRAIGATRWQVVLVFARLAALLGLIGAALGIPLGFALANAAIAGFREELQAIFLNAEVSISWPTVSTIVLAFVAGVATAVLAALVPAIQAASDPPAQVVRRRTGRAAFAWRLLHWGVCLALIAGGGVMILLRHSLPHRLGGFGGMMIVLVGLLMAAPIFVSLMVAIFNPLLRRVLPIEARLASDNLTRAPGRTGVVIGALGAGVAVMLQTAGVGLSNEVPVIRWLDSMLRADRYVLGGGFATAMSSMASMEPTVVAELNALSGVERATGLRFARPDYNGTIVYLLAVDTRPFGEMLSKRSDLAQLEKYRDCQGRRVLISDNFAARHKKKPGDTIVLAGANGPVTLEVLDTVVDYSWSRGTIIMDRSAYAQFFGDTQIDLAHVFVMPGQEAVARQSLDDYLQKNGLAALGRDAMREYIGGLVTKFFVLAYLQQFVVGVVAALGVVTALLISVLQRKRELGLLLAVGATPSQVIRSVLWEAFFLGAIGTVLGIAIGLPLEWYIVKVIFYEESGFTLEMLVPWKQAFSIAIGSVVLATLAGILPAWHAVRTNITDAIAYE